MGTWTNDISGQGLAHARPLTAAERTRERRIVRRWRDWEPVLLHEARKAHVRDIPAELLRLRTKHRRVFAALLESGLVYRQIIQDRAIKLDDPRISDELRAECVFRVQRKWTLTPAHKHPVELSYEKFIRERTGD